MAQDLSLDHLLRRIPSNTVEQELKCYLEKTLKNPIKERMIKLKPFGPAAGSKTMDHIHEHCPTHQLS